LIIEERTEKDSNHSELRRMGGRAVECRHRQPISPEVTERTDTVTNGGTKSTEAKRRDPDDETPSRLLARPPEAGVE